MKKKKTRRNQTDLFAQDRQRMQWQHLPKASQRKTQRLLAKLLFGLSLDRLESQIKERHHAC